MYEVLIKEGNTKYSRSTLNLIDLLILFQKWASNLKIVIIYQRVIFTRVKSKTSLFLIIISPNNSKIKLAQELNLFSKTNSEYKFYIRNAD